MPRTFDKDAGREKERASTRMKPPCSVDEVEAQAPPWPLRFIQDMFKNQFERRKDAPQQAILRALRMREK